MNTPALLRRGAFLLCTLCTLALALVSDAKTIPIPTAKNSGITIQMTPAFDEWNGNGFMPVLIEISNSTPYQGNWEVSIFSKTQLPYRFSVPPGGTLREIIYLNQNLGEDYRDIRTSWEGTAIERKAASSISLTDNPGWRTREEYSYIGEKSLPAKQATSFEDAIKDNGNWNASFSIMDWPADPRVYTSKEILIVPEETFTNRIDTPHRQAILDWAATGGVLWLVTNDKNLKKPIQNHQFGRILHLPDIEELSLKERKDFLDTLIKDTRKNLQKMPNCQPTITNQEALAYKLGEPSMFLGFLLFVFALLAGPVSLKYWAPVGKRQRLFVIIPSLALVFSSILAVAILFSEGIGGQGIRKTRILLFPDSHSAFICQNQICRTGVIIGQSFPLDEKVDMKSSRITNITETSMGMEHEGNYVRNRSTASGNWFPDRSMLKQSLGTFTQTRARVTLLPESRDGAPVLLSTFPTSLSNVIFRDEHGQFWKIPNLPTGTKVSAQPVEKPNQQYKDMQENTFLADAEKNDKLGPIPSHPDIHWNQDTIQVTGPVSIQPSTTR